MARVEFENIFKGRVIDNIQKLIKQTIPGIPLYYDEHKGQESFLIRPISDTFVDYASNAHIRTYVTEISFQVHAGSEFNRANIQRLTDKAELVKRIFFDNRDLEALNINQWFNGNVSEIIYEKDEEDTERERFVMTFECNVNEGVS
jgi:maltooligosyltrehalose synthase